jgi:hypothetical protein
MYGSFIVPAASCAVLPALQAAQGLPPEPETQYRCRLQALLVARWTEQRSQAAGYPSFHPSCGALDPSCSD